MQFRKALGVPENQPAPEQKVIEAALGKMGPQLKQMADTICYGTAGPGSTPDQAQPGGEPAPPSPRAAAPADNPQDQPGSETGGKMGAATIFGRSPVSSTGEQEAKGEPTSDDEDEDDMPRGSAIFGRR